MRSASVFTHLRCNQRCSYCRYRRPTDDPGQITRASVEARIDAAVAAGAREIVLTGGEPTLRGDLGALVAYAKSRGADVVTLETNATTLDETHVRQLGDAGLARAVVNLVGFSPRVDDITEDPGGFAATLRGLGALVASGLEVEVKAALTRATKETTKELPAGLSAHHPGQIRALRIAVPHDAPVLDELLSYAEAAPLITELADAARRVGLPLRLDPDASPPPCVFESPERIAHLFSLARGGTQQKGFSRVAACAACDLADRCPGMRTEHLARFGDVSARPLVGDRLRRRLSTIASVEEQVTRELVTHERNTSVHGGLVDEDIIRVNFHCNQACRFCFVSTHLPAADDTVVERAIDEASAAGRRITLSGGEPTLHPRLAALVSRAARKSREPVRLQTNAIRLADTEYTRTLVEAGVREAFVSLHGSTAAIADAVTSAPGTYVKTVAGIDALVGAGVLVVLNFVVCESNQADLPDYVTFVASRWPGVRLNVSFVAPSTDVVPRDRALIPRYSDAMPFLARALAAAAERDVQVVGLESMCGVPLCLVPGDLSHYRNLPKLPAGLDAGEFQRAAACATCDLRDRCHGVRRGYAELHGTDELVGVRFDPEVRA